MAKNPISGKEQQKNIYVQKIIVGGKAYIVGSGIY